MNQATVNKLNYNAIFLVLASVICISPIFLSTGILTGNILSLLFLICIFILNYGKLSKLTLMSVIILLSLSLINAFYWSSMTFKVGIYFYAILLIIFTFDYSDIYKYIDYLSTIFILMLIGCIIGFFYAYFGGQALLAFPNEDGRPNGLFLTTFSSSYFDGLIRPSAIYDEPGALSFLLCITTALRESFGMNRKISWILLIGGLVTLSTAHAIFFVCFYIKTQWISLKRFLTSVFFATVILYILMNIESPISVILEYIFNRFSIVDGSFVGDNRSPLIVSAYNYLDLKTFLFGLDGDCIMGSPSCITKGYTQYCCNPLTNIVHYGIFLSIPYYASICFILFKSIKHKDLVIFGVFLLLLQRPYIMAYGYSVILFIYLYSLTFNKKNVSLIPKNI